MIALAWSLVALMLTAAQPAPPQAVTPPAPAALPAAVEREAKAIERMVIAPCCWMQPVSDHQSPASDEVKQQIRARLAAGMTRQQVLDAFVDQYGARVLAEPPNKGFSRFLYLTPVAVFGLSGVGLLVFVRRMTARRGGARQAAGAPQAERQGPGDGQPAAPDLLSYEEKLDDELREMD